MLSETGTGFRGYKIVSMLSSAEHEIFHSEMLNYGHFNIFEWGKMLDFLVFYTYKHLQFHAQMC